MMIHATMQHAHVPKPKMFENIYSEKKTIYSADLEWTKKYIKKKIKNARQIPPKDDFCFSF